MSEKHISLALYGLQSIDDSASVEMKGLLTAITDQISMNAGSICNLLYGLCVCK